MTDDDLQPLVAAQYLALAELLDGLASPLWDTPSFCEGWRVREVVAHLTMPARYSEDEFMAELRDAEFDFTRLSNRVASRDAMLPTDELVRNLRDEVMQHWTPPGGGYHGALNHVVIHGLDITVPRGGPRRSSDAAILIVLNDLHRRWSARELRHRHQRTRARSNGPRLVLRIRSAAARYRRKPCAPHLWTHTARGPTRRPDAQPQQRVMKQICIEARPPWRRRIRHTDRWFWRGPRNVIARSVSPLVNNRCGTRVPAMPEWPLAPNTRRVRGVAVSIAMAATLASSLARRTRGRATPSSGSGSP